MNYYFFKVVITTRKSIVKCCAVVFQLPGKQATPAKNPSSTDEAERKCPGKERETSHQSYEQPSEEEKIRPVKCVTCVKLLSTLWVSVIFSKVFVSLPYSS